jgi:hypothetical protein
MKRENKWQDRFDEEFLITRKMQRCIQNEVKLFIQSEINRAVAEERNRVVDIAVERAKQWKEKGFEIDTLIDGLKVIKLEEHFKDK